MALINFRELRLKFTLKTKTNFENFVILCGTIKLIFGEFC